MGYDSRMQTPREQALGGLLSPRNILSSSQRNLRDNGGLFSAPTSPRVEQAGGLINSQSEQIVGGMGMRYSLNKLPAVSEFVKPKQDFGIEGYFIPHFNAALDKPRVTKFSPTKQRKTFIDFSVK